MPFSTIGLMEHHMKASWLGSFSEVMEHADEITTFYILQPGRLCAAGGDVGLASITIISSLDQGCHSLTHPLHVFNEAPEPLAINQSPHS
jgi:hypothetical protein